MSTSIFDSLDHYVAQPRISGLTLSPDGKRLVTSVQTLNTQKNGYVTALWEVDPTSAQPARRLTRSSSGEASPAFAANGDLYFTSARSDESGHDDDAALWCLPAAGGEAAVVNRRPSGVTAALPSTSAETIAVTAGILPGATDEASHRKLHSARKEASVKAILHDSYPVRFWDHDLGPARPSLFILGEEEDPVDTEAGTEDQNSTGTTGHKSTDSNSSPAATSGPFPSTVESRRRRLKNVLQDVGSQFTGEAHISPDGSTALVGITSPEPQAERRATVAIVDLATGQRRTLLDDPGMNYFPGPISPDGSTAVITSSIRPTPQQALEPQLHVIDLSTGALTRLAEDVDLWLSPASAHPWADSSTLVATADHQGRGAVFTLDVATAGTATEVPVPDAVYTDVLPADRQSAYALRSSYEFPTEVVRIDLTTGETQRLQNPVERPELPGRLEDIATAAEDGVRIRSWLALPEGASAANPAPLLLWIHGGPLGSWNAWSWRWNPWLAVAEGYAVLLPDPALSTGYGQEFIQRGWNAWGDKPYTDLMAATDAAEAREDIDQTRTAAMGGSFGGYMANWVAGHTDRFSAIVTHASLWSLDQFGPTTDMSPFWRRQIDQAMVEAHSPHDHVEKIVSPMLVIHGDKDYRVPIGEGLRLWYELLADSGAAADADGQTIHRFLYFPDENHWILKPQHAVIWYRVVFAFLAEHVLGETRQLPDTLGLSAPAPD